MMALLLAIHVAIETMRETILGRWRRQQHTVAAPLPEPPVEEDQSVVYHHPRSVVMAGDRPVVWRLSNPNGWQVYAPVPFTGTDLGLN